MIDKRRCRAIVLLAIAAIVLAALAVPLQTLRLSVQVLRLLPAVVNYQSPGRWTPLPPDIRSVSCDQRTAHTYPSLSAKRTDASRYRLQRYIFLSCQDEHVLASWASTALTRGFRPDTADIVYFGDVLERQGRAPVALVLRRMNPNTAMWFVNMGQHAIGNQEGEPSIERYFQLAQQIDPTPDMRKTHMYMYFCMKEIREGKPSGIGAACETLVQVEKSATSHTLRAQQLVLNDQPEQALSHLLLALELDPNSPGAYYWASLAYARLGDAERARSLLRSALRLAPQFPLIALELAQLEAKAGCCQAARTALLAAINSPDATLAGAREVASRAVDECVPVECR